MDGSATLRGAYGGYNVYMAVENRSDIMIGYVKKEGKYWSAFIGGSRVAGNCPKRSDAVELLKKQHAQGDRVIAGHFITNKLG